MPVADNEPHATTVRAADAPYGCKDKEYGKGYYAPQRIYTEGGNFTVGTVWIPHTMTTDCGSTDISATDPRCEACSWRSEG